VEVLISVRHVGIMAFLGLVLLLVAVPASGKGASEDQAASGGRNDSATGGGSRVIDLPPSEEFSLSELGSAAQKELRSVRRGTGGPAELANVAYAIESVLRGKGYPDALVTYSMYDTSAESGEEVYRATEWARVDRVEVRIRPGERVYVGRVTFTGVSALERSRVRAFFPASRGDAQTPYHRRDFEAGLQKLLRLYELEGYTRVAVAPMRTTRRRETNRLFYDIEIRVTEGRRFVITGVHTRGSGLSEPRLEELRKQVATLLGEPYVPRRAVEGAIALRNFLGRLGYDAEVTHEAEFSTSVGPDGGAGATLNYTIRTGPLLVVDNVVVRPSDQERLRTRKDFVRSFVPLRPGETINLDVIDEAENDLYSLGLFSFVDIVLEREDESPIGGSEDGEGSPRPADVVVSLTEAESREVELSAGWGSYELAMASTSFSDRNVFGIGRQWSTTVYGSFRSYGVETSVSDSVLLGPAGTLSLSGSYDFRDTPAYDITTIESRLKGVFRLSPVWLAEASYTLGTDEISDAVEEADIPSARRYRAARLRWGISRDGRDSIVLPSAGSRLGLSALYAGPAIGSELHYAEGAAFGDYHHTIIPRVVLTFAGTARTRKPLAGADTLPIQERLFLGGANSVRSFGRDQLGPVGESGDIIGGLTALEGTAELSVRIVGPLYGAAFYDLGIVSLEPLSADGDFGQAVGVGLRYHLPVGPIRVDFGYNPGAQLGAESRWALHFAVGFSY
jgi:outer membrane protein assembly factor BamA